MADSKSNYFIYNNNLWSDDNTGFGLYNLSAGLRIRINKENLSDISTQENAITSFKTWLSTHNVEIYYPLKTPTDTEITDTSLITALNEVEAMLSYEGQTNIYSTNELSPIFDVEAYQSTKLLLENIENRLTLVEG